MGYLGMLYSSQSVHNKRQLQLLLGAQLSFGHLRPLTVLPSCSKLCQSSKRECGFVSPHATCCFWVVFFPACLFVFVSGFVCCSCSLFVVLVIFLSLLFFSLLFLFFCLLFLFFVCCSCSLFVVLVLCLLFLLIVLLVWWFVLFPKRLRVGIQRPQWGKNTCEDSQKAWLY